MKARTAYCQPAGVGPQRSAGAQASDPLNPWCAQAATGGCAASGPAAAEAAACGALERGLLLFKLLGNLHAPSDALPEVTSHLCHIVIRTVVCSASSSGPLLFTLCAAVCTLPPVPCQRYMVSVAVDQKKFIWQGNSRCGEANSSMLSAWQRPAGLLSGR